MIVTFAFIVVLIGLIVKADKQFGTIENTKVKYTHVGLMFFSILITSLSLTVFFNFIINFEETIKTVYVQNGLLSPTVNLIMMLSNTILSVLILFTTLRLAMRSEKARKIFVTLIPLLFLTGTVKTLNDLYVRGTTATTLSSAMMVTIFLIILLYSPLFFFYINKNIKKQIFDIPVNK
jgi:hypothetical protein